MMRRWEKIILSADTSDGFANFPGVHLNSHNKGFSLLELLVVLMVMALAVSFVGPRITNRRTVELKAQVRRIVALFKYAERKAVIEGRPEKVSIHRVLAARENTSHQVMKVTMIQKDGRVTLSTGNNADDGESKDRRPGKEQREESIFFFPDGGNSGGQIKIDVAGAVALIKIDPFSGEISVDYKETR